MNKTQFIDYISLIPEEIQFSEMMTHVRGHEPQPDGMYKYMTKRISFECEYTEQVHKLPNIVEKQLSKYEYSSVGETTSFYKTCLKLRKSIIRRFKKEGCGDDPVMWDAIPMFVLAELLNDCVHRKDEKYFKTMLLAVRYSLKRLKFTISDEADS